jgi:isopenicillin-N N-acyltransferase-like protein
VEELKGIAEGAEMSYEQILRLNLCEEVWNRTTGWCTTICFATAGGSLLLGKTQDVGRGDERLLVLQRVTHNDRGHDFVRGSFAGTIWTSAGLNSAGLALAGSSLKPRDLGQHGVPMHAALQTCLEGCASVDAAEAMLSDLAICGKGVNLLIVDKESRCILLEILPGARQQVHPRDGMLFATNHCTAPRLSARLVDDPEWQENSSARHALLSKATPTVPRNRAGMQRLLRWHDEIGSICQHGGAGGRFHTIAAYVLAPVERELWLAKGSPCEGRFVRYQVHQ